MVGWTIPVETMNAVTLGSGSDSYGSTVDLGAVMTNHAAQYVLSRVSGDTGFATLEGSLNGTDWYSIGGNSPFGVSTGTEVVTARVVVTDQPARFIRVRANASVGSPSLTVLNTSQI